MGNFWALISGDYFSSIGSRNIPYGWKIRTIYCVWLLTLETGFMYRIKGKIWALISGVFSDLRSPEIRTICYGTENHPYFCSQFLEGAKISKFSQNWRQFWAVSAAPRNWGLLELCVLCTRTRYDTTTYPICRITFVTHTKPSHLRRSPPTAYGAAEMASPSYGSDSRRRRRSSSCSSC